MTLTKAALMEAARQRFEWIDVDGFGRVGIRSVSNIKRTQRDIAYARDESALEASSIHPLLDQLMVSETEPMFTDADIPALLELDSARLGPLYEAIAAFNGDDQKKVSGGSTATTKS